MLKITRSDFSIEPITTDKDSNIQLAIIKDGSSINLPSTRKSGAIERVRYDSNKIDEVDIINTNSIKVLNRSSLKIWHNQKSL